MSVKSYRVNNIFYSLQGEGRNTGRAALFIRFAGCNLRCPFCDTEFDSYREMTAEDLMGSLLAYPISHRPSSTSHLERPLVVLTGGEPTLQVGEDFVDLLHAHGYEVAMESNGTRPAPRNLDWLTVSPKSANYQLPATDADDKQPDEIKVIFGTDQTDSQLSSLNSSLPTPHSPLLTLYLQPCDTGDAECNARIIARCVEYIKKHPQWRLSLQTHKLINIE